MNTPHLDALMNLAGQQSGNIIELHRADMCKRKLDELFATHGPALVAMLKKLLSSVNDNQLLEAEARTERLLTQLDSDAKMGSGL